MTNEQLEQFVSKLVMRLSDIDSLKTSVEAMRVSMDAHKDITLDLKFEYGIRHAKNEAKLEAIYEVVTKQNSRVSKLEETTTKDREEHLVCKAPNKVNQLEKKIEEMLTSSDKINSRRISIFAIIIAGLTLIINSIDKLINYIK